MLRRSGCGLIFLEILEVEFNMLHRHLIFSFVLLVQQTGTIIADDLYLGIELVSMATTYL